MARGPFEHVVDCLARASFVPSARISLVCAVWSEYNRITPHLLSKGRCMISRIASMALILVGLGILGAAGYLALQPELYVDVPQLDQEINVAAGKETTVTLHLVNRSGRPVRVLGVAPC